MPTSNWQNIGESIELIRKWMPKSVLDVGCGFGRWGFLCREFLELWEGRCFKPEWKVRIDAIEGFEAYLSPVQRHLYDEVHVGNAKDVLPRLGTYDLIILGDVLEHFSRDDALAFLAACRAHLTPNGHVLLHIPLGEEWEQGDGPGGNVLERHLSAWTLSELQDLGAEASSVFQDYVGRDFAVVVYGATAAAASASGNVASRAEAPLTIAFATQEWPGGGRVAGGAGIYAATLARALVRRGHAVHVVTCAHAGLPAERVENGIRVHRIAEAPPDAKNPEDVKRYSRALAARIRELDALHAFDVVEFAEWAAEGWAFHPRRDQAMVVRLAAPSSFVRRFEYGQGTPAERRVDELERWPAERADLVTAPSRMIAGLVAQEWSFDAARTAVIPNAVDTESFSPAAASREAGAPVVLCVNRLTPLKGPEVFVRAAALVHARFPSARFRMVGRVESWDGERGDARLHRLAATLGLPADRLEIAGGLPHEALPAAYAAATVCVNPSLGESFSLTSAEALASGVACVLSDAMGIREQLTDGKDCLMARAGDAAEFAERILRLLGDDALRASVGAAGRIAAVTRLATGVVAAQTEAAYRAALARVRARAPLPRTRLNVAILTHNALEWTQRCLDSLARCTPVPHHVFVLDNASTDGTREWLAKHDDSRVHVTLGAANLGVPGGRNALLRTVLPYLRDDAVLVFLDNDVEVLEGWHGAILQHFDAHPEVGIAGESGLPFVVRSDSRELLPIPPERPAAVDVVSGFCLAARAACAREIGLFDERLGLFWHEDDDWCIRAIMNGWEVSALGTGKVIHHEHKSGAALPAIATGGSPANQKYLAAKWRSLGLVDETGRVARKKHAATFALRAQLGATLDRGGPIPQDELERAAQDLAALLMSKDVGAHVEKRTGDLSPTLLALLDVNVAQARAQSNTALVAALEEVAELAHRCRFSRLLREHVAVSPRGSGGGSTAPRLSKLCDSADWDRPDWRSAASATWGDGGSRSWYARHRKSWECGQVGYALRRLLPNLKQAQGLVLNASNEPVVFGLANEARCITAVDVYGESPAAPAGMLDRPEAFAPIAFARNRLVIARMDPLSLGFPDDSFDFAVLCSLHRFGTEDAARRALAECSRVVKPGGVAIVVTEVGLNAVEHPGFFLPAQLSRLFAGPGLRPVEEADFSVDDATLDGFVDLAQGADKRPHLVLAQGNVLFTSGVFVLERPALETADLGVEA